MTESSSSKDNLHHHGNHPDYEMTAQFITLLERSMYFKAVFYCFFFYLSDRCENCLSFFCFLDFEWISTLFF